MRKKEVRKLVRELRQKSDNGTTQCATCAAVFKIKKDCFDFISDEMVKLVCPHCAFEQLFTIAQLKKLN